MEKRVAEEEDVGHGAEGMDPAPWGVVFSGSYEKAGQARLHTYCPLAIEGTAREPKAAVQVTGTGKKWLSGILTP